MRRTGKGAVRVARALDEAIHIPVKADLLAVKIAGIVEKAAVKVFMGSSTGNMLVDHEEVLARLFANSRLPIVTHCEDTTLINLAMKKCQAVNDN